MKQYESPKQVNGTSEYSAKYYHYLGILGNHRQKKVYKVGQTSLLALPFPFWQQSGPIYDKAVSPLTWKTSGGNSIRFCMLY